MARGVERPKAKSRVLNLHKPCFFPKPQTSNLLRFFLRLVHTTVFRSGNQGQSFTVVIEMNGVLPKGIVDSANSGLLPLTVNRERAAPKK